MSLPGRLSHPVDDFACVGVARVKPKPPSAVASRGLTPATPTKRGSALDVSLTVDISILARGVVSQDRGNLPPTPNAACCPVGRSRRDKLRSDDS